MAQVKGQRDVMVSSNENKCRPLSSGEVEGMSWQGPRTILLQKNSQGFGFTLRHFIVFPPVSSLYSLKDEENGNAAGKGCQWSCLEPMDTIFIKSVKENGPAQQAGLCTGDRLVKVNGESILGKTYSQVITLIQNSENILELSIMPKDEDVLQLVYSQDSYLKDNQPYSGEAQKLREPPPLCCPSTKPSSSSTAPQHSHNLQSPLDTWQCRPSPTISPLGNCFTAASSNTSGWPYSGDSRSPSRQHHGRPSSAISVLDFHIANHDAAIASATLPLARKRNLPASTHTLTDAFCHQALSEWYYNQAEAAEDMSPYHHSLSQHRLVELGLGLALGPRCTSASITSIEDHRRETLLCQHQAATASDDSYWLGSWGGISPTGSRSCSESLLAAYAEYEHNYGRSMETLAQASALVLPRYRHSSQGSHMTKLRELKGQTFPGGHQHTTTMKSSIKGSFTLSPSVQQSGQQIAEPQTRQVKEEEQVGYKNYNPSFSCKAGHLLKLAQSFRESSHSGLCFDWSLGSRSSLADIEVGMAHKPQSSPAPSVSEEEKAQLNKDKEVVSCISKNQEEFLRQKSTSGQRTPGQALSLFQYTTPVESGGPTSLTPRPGTPSSISVGPCPSSRATGSLVQHAINSLSSIPFIGNIKGRRSSYLLAITTERSKSCDEGLNTFREEGRVFSTLPKRVRSFFTDGCLESLQAQEKTKSKRHSTSELETKTFSDVCKDGWLHYKQILKEKGKKASGGMRPWKRVFSVLRSQSLFLYKDKREAVLHGAGVESSQGEHPLISIQGCLIDIAYRETKRKHALRLTTQDFCEYLLQAEDREDMLDWIRVVRENSKIDNEEICFSRQALINKKLHDYRKHSLTGNKPDSSFKACRMMPPFLLAKTDASVNQASRTAPWGISIMRKTKKAGSAKAFGVRLEDCQPAVSHEFVPLIVEMCCGMVETRGLEYTGIYRVPGNNTMVSNLQEHLNKGMDINTAEERWQDLNVISSLLKSFFRKLPEPLFTDDKYNDFIDANRIEDAEDRLKTLKKLIHGLPDHYYHTLRFLLGHLKRVADHSAKNKMEPRNLALVFGPTLVRMSEDNMTNMVTHMPDRYKIVETLILHHDWFFSNGESDMEEKAPEDTQDMQPMPNIGHLLSNIGRQGMSAGASDSTTSDSLKSKKDLNAVDRLLVSIISAVTQKPKKHLSINLQGSSTDKDCQHKPVKASNYVAEEGGEGEEEREREEETIKGKKLERLQREEIHFERKIG